VIIIDPYVSDRLKSDKATNLLGFVDELRMLWDSAGKLGNIKRKFQKDDVDGEPTIAYRLYDRYPEPHFKERAPRERETIRDPYRDGEFVEIHGQFFTVVVEFSIYALEDEVADEVTSELEDFIFNYKGYFKKKGVNNIFFLRQGPDELFDKYKVHLAKRTLYFDITIEKIIPKMLNQIGQVNVEANVHERLN